MRDYFSEKEKACKCCGEIVIAPGFLEELNMLREMCGHALLANSICRCPVHNEAEGGKKRSFHLISSPSGCCAADINTANWSSQKRWKFIKLAMSRGFSVGVASTFIHVDLRHRYDITWPNPVFFIY